MHRLIQLNSELDSLIRFEEGRYEPEGTETATITKYDREKPRTMEVDVVKLINRLRSRPIKKVPLDELYGTRHEGPPSRSPRDGFSKKRMEATDTRHPLIIDNTNYVINGRHRWWKLKGQGKKHARVIRATDKDLKAAELSVLLGDLIEFQSQQKTGPRWGKIAADAAIGAGVSTLGTAGLLAGTGALLGRKAPALGHMLTTAAKQHYKLFNPKYSVPMLKSLPAASGLFGKQMRVMSTAEKLASGGELPTLEKAAEAYKRAGVSPGKDVEALRGFTQKYGRSPSETMERSVGLLSGSASTAIGAAGGIATSSGWRKEKKLSALLSDLIQFKLYQPGRGDEPPEELPQFTPGEPVDYTVQRHEARRAGLHRDIRIGTPRHGLYSWATRKELPQRGGRIAIHPQPIHPHDYLGWEGEIPSGYGAGKVSTEDLGKALITKSSPEQTNLTIAHQRGSHRFVIVKTPRGHLLVREKHPEPPTAEKPSYKSLSPQAVPEHLKSLPAGSVVQPKIDGALVFVKSHKGKLEVFSHRKSKSGEPILHTERFFKGRPYGDLEGKTILGELYGTRKGKAVEPQELGGILNAHIGKSLEKQQQQGVDLKIMPFDIQGKGAYPERLAKLKDLVSRKLSGEKFTLPEEATTPRDALALHNTIAQGKHPLTSEGVVIHPPTGKMIKVKNVQEENVKIHSTFPGKGKFEGSHGGFYYADKSGRPLGRVGTGFSDETRAELQNYIGRTARVRHQGKFPSGKLRAPSLIAIEENK